MIFEKIRNAMFPNELEHHLLLQDDKIAIITHDLTTGEEDRENTMIVFRDELFAAVEQMKGHILIMKTSEEIVKKIEDMIEELQFLQSTRFLHLIYKERLEERERILRELKEWIGKNNGGI